MLWRRDHYRSKIRVSEPTTCMRQSTAFLPGFQTMPPWYLRRMLGSTTIRLRDWDRTVRLTVDGLEDDPTLELDTDVALHSSSLLLRI